MNFPADQKAKVERFIFEKWISGDDMSFLSKEDTHDKRSRTSGRN